MDTPNDTDLYGVENATETEEQVQPEQQAHPEPQADYEVGYGKPPEHTRFQPGVSGNPHRGPNRPPKTYSAALMKAANKTVRLNDNGESRVMTKMEAAGEITVQEALKGARWAMDKLERLEFGGKTQESFKREFNEVKRRLREALEELEKHRTHRTGVLVIPGNPDRTLLEIKMVAQRPEEVWKYMQEHPEEVLEMLRLKHEEGKRIDYDKPDPDEP
jgi:hypothetical protein